MQQELDSWRKKWTKKVSTYTTVVALASNGDLLIAVNIEKRTERYNVLSSKC